MLLHVAITALVAIAVADQCGDCPGFCACFSRNVNASMNGKTELLAKIDKMKVAKKVCAEKAILNCSDELKRMAKTVFECFTDQLGCTGEEACKAVFEFLGYESEMEKRRRRRRGADGDKEKTKGKRSFAKEKDYLVCLREKTGMSDEELGSLNEELKPIYDAKVECMMEKCYDNDEEALMRFLSKERECVMKAFFEVE